MGRHPMSELISHLRRNDSEKWNDVFLWFGGNWYDLMTVYWVKFTYKYQISPFLKELMLPITENVAVTFTEPRFKRSPLMVAALIDDTDSILKLIKRGADVNRQDYIGRTALHYAAKNRSINACATLLDNDAHIDAASYSGYTPLMGAAYYGQKNMYQFLIKKGAAQTLINNDGKTASQLVRFRER